MISVLNHLRRLNGSKLLILVFFLLASCSTKVVKVNKPKKVPTEREKEVVVEPKKPEIQKPKNVKLALLLPFDIRETEINKKGTERASMAIEFYQGFLLGVDSVLNSGTNINVQVLDTKNADQSMGGIIRQSGVRNADLVIGPVFPESLKQLNLISQQFYVSPLAASMPDEFNNPRIISMIPSIRLHAEAIYKYISHKYPPSNLIVVLINSKTEESEQLGAILRSNLAVDNAKYTFQEYISVAGLETKLQKSKDYVVLISSSDKDFVASSLDKLNKIKSRLKYPIDVIGHPNWIKQNYNTGQLQALNTVISTSYFVNYKRAGVTEFLKKYRAAYQFEPTEFSFKGFDTGYYFARLIARYGKDFIGHLPKEKYVGLQNNYSFYYDPALGYMNTGVSLVKYKNFALVPID